MKKNSTEIRDSFRNKRGFVLACIGSAVGMGNIWRFPIMVSKYGGLTFLIPYVLFVILIGSTGVIEEFSLGRQAAAGPVGAFGMCTEDRWNKRLPGEWIGAIPIVGAFMLGIGYTVVLGWIFKYMWLALSGGLFAMGQDMSVIGPAFDAVAPGSSSIGEAVSMMLKGGLFQVGNSLWQMIALLSSLAIMALGVGKGIEKANKIMMPVLFFLFVALALYVCTLSGSEIGYRYIFTLNLRGLLNLEVWVYAFGQAFFSLSVAGNGSVIYGSYLSRNEDIPASARNVAVFDTIAALLAMLVILPAMGVGNVTPDKPGPGLMFVFLPNVFNGMTGGRLIGIIFFICVLFAGVSSIINLYEAPVAFLQEKLHLGRLPAVIIIGILGGCTSLLIQPWTSQWMDLVSIYICPLGALLAGVMFFWVLKKDSALASVNEGHNGKALGNGFYKTGRYLYCLMAFLALAAGAIYGGIG